MHGREERKGQSLFAVLIRPLSFRWSLDFLNLERPIDLRISAQGRPLAQQAAPIKGRLCHQGT